DFQYHNTGHVGTTLLHHSGAVNLGIVHRQGDWTFRLEGKDLLATSLSDQTWYGAIRDLHRRIYHDTRRVEISVGYNIRFRLSKNPDFEAGREEKDRF
ncbi:MAG: hypothetical protein HUJ51_06245, partial [Eggerthellaceae bacterium]|nr:hypothetical protein [Eggerthellaceae bacterium]